MKRLRAKRVVLHGGLQSKGSNDFIRQYLPILLLLLRHLPFPLPLSLRSHPAIHSQTPILHYLQNRCLRFPDRPQLDP